MTVKELRAELSRRGLDTSGLKATLQARLRGALIGASTAGAGERDSSLAEEGETKGEKSGRERAPTMVEEGASRKRNRWDQAEAEGEKAPATQTQEESATAFGEDSVEGRKRSRWAAGDEGRQLVSDSAASDGTHLGGPLVASQRRAKADLAAPKQKSEWDSDEEEEAGAGAGQEPAGKRRTNRWDATEPTPKQRSRWDETPQVASGGAAAMAASMETPASFSAP